MHCNLISLPAELQLKVIKELLQDEDTPTHTSARTKYSCIDWPPCIPEKQDHQDEPIKIHHDLIRWSCTCSHFRKLLAPTIFKVTKLVNDDWSGSSLKALAKSLHNVQVTDLHFIGPGLDDAQIGEAASLPDTEETLSSSVETLLRNLQWFPNLETLSVKFDNRSAMEEWDESTERTDAWTAWCSLISSTSLALTQNKPPHFKHFEIRQPFWREIAWREPFMWEGVSSFSVPAFHDFLGHLEKFTFSIYDQDLPEYLMPYANFEFPNLMDKLDAYLFNHLANVTTLSIKAPYRSSVGLSNVPLSLTADQMPLLTTLRLDYLSLASLKLIEFFAGHKHTLEDLILHKCYTAVNCDEFFGRGNSWSQLFTSLFSPYPTRLRRFELVAMSFPGIPFETKFTRLHQLTGLHLPREGDEGKNVFTILRQDPERILFPYVHMREKGMEDGDAAIIYDAEESFKAFLKGEDQSSYDRLMELVEANAERAMVTKSESKFLEWQARSLNREL